MRREGGCAANAELHLQKRLNGPATSFGKEKAVVKTKPHRRHASHRGARTGALVGIHQAATSDTGTRDHPRSETPLTQLPGETSSGPRNVGQSVRPFRKVPTELPVLPEAPFPGHSGLSVAGGGSRRVPSLPGEGVSSTHTRL